MSFEFSIRHDRSDCGIISSLASVGTAPPKIPQFVIQRILYIVLSSLTRIHGCVLFVSKSSRDVRESQEDMCMCRKLYLDHLSGETYITSFWQTGVSHTKVDLGKYMPVFSLHNITYLLPPYLSLDQILEEMCSSTNQDPNFPDSFSVERPISSNGMP